MTSSERTDLQTRAVSEAEGAVGRDGCETAVLRRENEALKWELAEAREQQIATSEILQVISSSAADLQHGLDAVAESASRLCNANDAAIFRVDGDALLTAAHYGSIPSLPVDERFPIRRNIVTGRAILDQRVFHIADLLAEPDSEFAGSKAFAARLGYRTYLAVPMLREGKAIGVIGLRRVDVQPFSDKQIELLKTFADQAVIAIENTRLFNELESRNRDLTEALEQQTATSEILRVISQSQRDVQPVFETIAENARKLCEATFAVVYTFDGKLIHWVAASGLNPGVEAFRQFYPMPLNRETVTTRAILARTVANIPDIREDAEYSLQGLAEAAGYRSALSIPMLRDGSPIGAISVTGAEPAMFSERQIAMLQTFADQAVIAIENKRLFTELQAKTQELTQSVEQLRSLAEVSRAVNSTLDLNEVLNTIAQRAVQLSSADGGALYEFNEVTGELLARATVGYELEIVDMLAAKPLLLGESVVGRAAAVGAPVQITDIAQDAQYTGRARDALERAGFRAVLAVPLLWEGHLVGGLAIGRKTAQSFAPELIGVLETFAAHSTLAIQNARLFHELEQKSRELEAASRHKSEFLANMSHELRTPLNAIIGFSEILQEQMFGELNAKQADYMRDIYSSGLHLLSLINDILDLSKIEAGRMELSLGEFDIPAAVDNAITLVRERAVRRGVKLKVEVDDSLGGLCGDERKFRQILLNLLSNAVKFTPEGGRVSLLAEPINGGVQVSVTDTGIGISAEDQKLIFEEFRQVGTKDQNKLEGTGLGLTLAKKFVELHGGRIWVHSEVGRGSTFTFTLPCYLKPKVG